MVRPRLALEPSLSTQSCPPHGEYAATEQANSHADVHGVEQLWAEDLPERIPMLKRQAGHQMTFGSLLTVPGDYKLCDAKSDPATFLRFSTIRNRRLPLMSRLLNRIPKADFEEQPVQNCMLNSIGYVRAFPGIIQLDTDLPELQGCMIGHRLSLKLLSEEKLATLPAKKMGALLEKIANTQHRVFWDQVGWQGFGGRMLPDSFRTKKDICGTSALLLFLLANNEIDMAEYLLKNRPIEIALDLADTFPQFYTIAVMQNIFSRTFSTITQEPDLGDHPIDIQMRAMGLMAAAFFKLRTDKKKELIEKWTVVLMQELEESGFEVNSANLGLLAGVIFSGGLHYSAAVAAKDAQIKEAFGNFILLAFACLDFAQLKSWGSGVAALVSLTIGLAMKHLWKIRDLQTDMNHLQGKLCARLMNLDVFKNNYDQSQLMDWIQTTRACNGFT